MANANSTSWFEGKSSEVSKGGSSPGPPSANNDKLEDEGEGEGEGDGADDDDDDDDDDWDE